MVSSSCGPRWGSGGGVGVRGKGRVTGTVRVTVTVTDTVMSVQDTRQRHQSQKLLEDVVSSDSVTRGYKRSQAVTSGYNRSGSDCT